jgi:hypothetical protein
MERWLRGLRIAAMRQRASPVSEEGSTGVPANLASVPGLHADGAVLRRVPSTNAPPTTHANSTPLPPAHLLTEVA